MSRLGSLYRDDFFTWTQDQAERLRSLGPGQRSNGLDPDHLAEEIGDLGNSELRAVESALMRAFQHFLKMLLFPEDQAQTHWRVEATAFLIDAQSHFSPGMRQRIDLEQIWDRALRLVSPLCRAAGLETPEARCPLPLDRLLDPKADIDGFLEIIACAIGARP